MLSGGVPRLQEERGRVGANEEQKKKLGQSENRGSPQGVAPLPVLLPIFPMLFLQVMHTPPSPAAALPLHLTALVAVAAETEVTRRSTVKLAQAARLAMCSGL